MTFRIQTRRRRLSVLGAGLAMLVALLGMLAGWGLGALHPRGLSFDGVCVAFSRRDLEIALANNAIRRDETSHNPSTWFFPAHSARVAMPGSSGWRPRQHRASMTIGTPAGTMVTLAFRVFVMPAWLLPLVLVPPTTLFLWLGLHGPQRESCRRCGYDLSGLSQGPCPECGQIQGDTRVAPPRAVRQ